MLLYQYPLQPAILSPEGELYCGTLQSLDDGCGHAVLDQLEGIGVTDLMPAMGVQLPAGTIPVHRQAIVKRIELYYLPDGERLYVERLCYITDEGHRYIPFKLRYRTPTRVLSNLVILKGVEAVQQEVLMPYFDGDELPIDQTVCIPYIWKFFSVVCGCIDGPSTLRINITNMLRHFAMAGDQSLFGFVIDTYIPDAITSHLVRILEELIPKYKFDSMVLNDQEMAAFIGECWVPWPPTVDRLTWQYLGQADNEITPQQLLQGHQGSSSDALPFVDRMFVPVVYDSSLNLIINDPEWYPVVDALNHESLTDFSATFRIHVAGTTIIPTLINIHGAQGRFNSPENTIQTLQARDMRPLMRAFEFLDVLVELGQWTPNMELDICKTFDEQVYIEIMDADGVRVIRQDYLDLAWLPLFGFGLAGGDSMCRAISRGYPVISVNEPL